MTIIEIYFKTCRGAPERALVHLYESLIVLHHHPEACEKFIDSVPYNDMDIDGIVHMLNALSPVKEKLYNWNEFTTKSKARLVELVGEEEAEVLMGVII